TIFIVHRPQMKKVNLERYFKLFTNEESERFFDNALKKQHITFVKREIPDSKFSEYFFNKYDIPLVDTINDQLKEKELEETVKLTSRYKPSALELLMMLVLIGVVITFIMLL
ncbi:MAG: hypothetical protein AB8B65_20835, partial [Kordia sp.]|uniref:hypothetical protein n=1 Tax=Kordia sp. TaxID=1965332 RepID=UPI00385E3AD1